MSKPIQTGTISAVRRELAEMRRRAKNACVSGFGAENERWAVCKHDLPKCLELIAALLDEREGITEDNGENFYDIHRALTAKREATDTALANFLAREEGR
jgi:hypothetical protein